MFVWILEPGVNDDRRRGAIEAFFELFLGDTGHRHGCYCDRAVRGLSTRDLAGRRAIERDDFCRRNDNRRGNRRRDAWARSEGDARNDGGTGCGPLKFRLDGPTRRPFSAMHAAEEHLARFTPHTVVVAAGKIAMNQIPHGRASRNTSLGYSPYRKLNAVFSISPVHRQHRKKLWVSCRKDPMSWIESAKGTCSRLRHTCNRSVQFCNSRLCNSRRSEGRWPNS